MSINCSKCKKDLPILLRVITCDSCKQYFHVKCCGITHKDFNSIKGSNAEWHCQHCKRNDIAFGLNLRQNTETAINSRANSQHSK